MSQFYGPKPALLEELTDKDFPAEKSVTVTLQDGSIIRLREAFYHREGNWIAVYTKQSGAFMFRLTTITTIKGLVRTEDDKFAFL